MSEKNLLENILQNPLVKQYRRGALTKKIYLLQSEGGSGKTTALLSLYLYLVQRSLSDMSVVPLFVDVKKLTEFGEEMAGSDQIGNMPHPIEKYIVKAYCGSDNDPKETMLEKVVHLFSPNNSPKFQKKYMYYLFLDGLNEVGFQAKQILWGEINSIAQADCVKIFVSSRTDEPNLPDGIAKLSLLPLKEEDIHAYLEHNFGGECTEKTDTRKINPSLVHILQIPMYLKVFRKTYNHKSPYPDIYEENIIRKADILDSYIQKLLNDNREKERQNDKTLFEFVVQYFLPAFAFQMVKNNASFIASDSDFKALRSNLQYFDSLAVPDEMLEAFQTNNFATKTACLNTGLLVFTDNQYTFAHQDWRDFFAAKHLINFMNADNDKLDDFEKAVDANIRRFTGELVREYSKTHKYSKAYDNKVDERKSECDFEQKEDLQAWGASPIEHFLQKHNLNSAQPLSAIATRNLIDIMKTSRNNHITAIYDALDLSCTSFINCYMLNSYIFGSKIDNALFLSTGHTECIADIAVSNNNKFMVSASLDTTLKFWNAETGVLMKTMKLSETSAPFSLTVSDDDNSIAVGSTSGEIFIVEVNRYKIKKKISLFRETSLNDAWIENISYVKGALYFVCNNTLYFCDPLDNYSVSKMTDDTILEAYFCNRNNICVSTTVNNEFIIWDLSTKEIIIKLDSTEIRIRDVLFSRDGKKIYICSLDAIYKLFLPTKTIESYETHKLGRTFSLLSDDYILTDDIYANKIYVFKLGDPEPVTELSGHKDNIRKIRRLSDNAFYSGDFSGEIIFWRLKPLKATQELLSSQQYSICLLQASPLDHKILCVGSDNSLILIDQEGYRIIERINNLMSEKIISFDYCSETQMIAFTTAEKNIYCLSLNQFKSPTLGRNWLFAKHYCYFADDLCFFHSAKALVSIGKEEGYIWGIDNCEMHKLKKLSNLTDFWNQRVKISPDDKYIVSADVGNYIHIYRVQDLTTFDYKEEVTKTGMSNISEVYLSEREFYVVSNNSAMLKAYNYHLEVLYEIHLKHNGLILSSDVDVNQKIMAYITLGNIVLLIDLESREYFYQPFLLSEKASKILILPHKKILIVGETGRVHFFDIKRNVETDYLPLQVALTGSNIDAVEMDVKLKKDLYFNGINIRECANLPFEKATVFCEFHGKSDCDNGDIISINEILNSIEKKLNHLANDEENERSNFILSKNDNTFTIVNEDGEKIVFEILFSFDDEERGHHYIAYTDNTMDEEGNTKVYASRFDPTKENPTLYPLESAEEWEKMEQLLASLSDAEDSEEPDSSENGN